MTIIVSEADIGHMASMTGIDMAGCLRFIARIAKEMDFTKIICNGDHGHPMGAGERINICPIRSFWPNPENMVSQYTCVCCPLTIFIFISVSEKFAASSDIPV